MHGSSRKVEQNGTLAEIKEHMKEEAQSMANGFSGGKHVTVSKERYLGPGKRYGDFAWQPYPVAVYRTFRLGSRYPLQFPWYGVELADIRSSASS